MVTVKVTCHSYNIKDMYPILWHTWLRKVCNSWNNVEGHSRSSAMVLFNRCESTMDCDHHINSVISRVPRALYRQAITTQQSKKSLKCHTAPGADDGHHTDWRIDWQWHSGTRRLIAIRLTMAITAVFDVAAAMIYLRGSNVIHMTQHDKGHAWLSIHSYNLQKKYNLYIIYTTVNKHVSALQHKAVLQTVLSLRMYLSKYLLIYFGRDKIYLLTYLLQYAYVHNATLLCKHNINHRLRNPIKDMN